MVKIYIRNYVKIDVGANIAISKWMLNKCGYYDRGKIVKFRLDITYWSVPSSSRNGRDGVKEVNGRIVI